MELLKEIGKFLSPLFVSILANIGMLFIVRSDVNGTMMKFILFLIGVLLGGTLMCIIAMGKDK